MGFLAPAPVRQSSTTKATAELLSALVVDRGMVVALALLLLGLVPPLPDPPDEMLPIAEQITAELLIQRGSAFRRCVLAELRRRGPFATTVELTITVAPGGRVREAHARADLPSAAPLTRCIEQVSSSTRLRVYPEAPVTVTYPLVITIVNS